MAGELDRLKQLLLEIEGIADRIREKLGEGIDNKSFYEAVSVIRNLNSEIKSLYEIVKDLSSMKLGLEDENLEIKLHNLIQSILKKEDVNIVKEKIRDILSEIEKLQSVDTKVGVSVEQDAADAIDEVIKSFGIKLKGFSLDEIENEFRGFTQFLRSIGVDIENITDRISTRILDPVKKLHEIRVPTELGKIKVYYRDDIKRFSTDLRELKEAFSELQLEEFARKFERAFEVARRRGFGPEHLRRVEEIANGVTRLTFAMQDANGITRRMVVYQNSLGQVLLDNQKRFLSFSDAIVRNTLEAARWAFAITTVYQGLRKLQDVIRDAIETQEKLASLAVVMGAGMEAFDEIFESASRVADTLGMKVGEVLDAYVVAYRAAGAEATNFAERSRIASKLLTDAMILSKLSGLEAAKSVDLLVASVRQLGLSLQNAVPIMDKWVYLSRHSSVMVQDFAEAFAIAGAIAKAVGVSFDEMSAMVAALAENTSYSGREIGNILRSLFSNIQSDTAEKELLRFGISIKNVDGSLRDFSEILEEIYTRFRQGIISEDEISRIGRAIGGGARRGPQFVALIKNYERVIQLTNELGQSNIQLGLSYAAVETKTETVQANINRMSNSFHRLAIVAGDKGGVLDAVNKVVKGITFLNNSLSNLLELTGPTGLIVAMGLLSKMFISSQYYVNALSGSIERLVYQMLLLRRVSREAAAEQATAFVLRNQGLIKKIGTILPIAIASSLTAEGTYASAFGAIGAIAGGVIGNVLGAVLGGILGQVVGGFVDDMVRQSEEVLAPKVQNILYEAISDAIKQAEGEEIEVDIDANTKRLEDKLINLRTKILTGAFLPSLIPGTFETVIFRKFRDILEAITGKEFRGKGIELFLSKPFAEASLSERTLAALVSDYLEFGEQFVRGQYGLTEEQIRALRDYVDLLGIAAAYDISKPFDEAQAKTVLLSSNIENLTGKLEVVSRIQEEYTRMVEDAYARGEISAREYSDALEKISRFQSALISSAEILGDEFIKISDDVSNMEDVYDRFARLILYATDEELKRVQSLIVAYKQLNAERAPKTEREELLRQIEKELDLIESNIARRQLKLPRVISARDLSLEQLHMVFREAARLQEEYIRQSIQDGLVADEEALRKYFQSVEPIFFITKEGLTNSIREGFEGVDIERFWSQALQNLRDRGLFDQELESKFQIKTLDILSSQRGLLYAALERAINKLKTFFPYFKFDPRPIGIIFKDNVTEILHTDLTALNLALQELIQVNKKQLDGIYNLPEGATFWVPWEAWQLAAQSAINAAQGTGLGWRETPPTIPEDMVKNTEQTNSILSDINNKLSTLIAEAEAITTVLQSAPREISQKVFDAVTSMEHGPVANLDEQMERYTRYLESKTSERAGYLLDKYLEFKRFEREQERLQREKIEAEIIPKQETGDTVSLFIGALRELSNRIMELVPVLPTEQDTYDEKSEIQSDIGNYFRDLVNAYKAFMNFILFQNEQNKMQSPETFAPPPTINFHVEIDNKSYLTLDGRVIATVVKKYLLQDLLRASRGSTISRNINIV